MDGSSRGTLTAMPGTLLVPSPGMLLPYDVGKETIVLDPEEHGFGPAGRLLLLREGKVAAWSFVGSLDPLRQPLALFSGLSALLRKADAVPDVRLFPLKKAPLAIQTALEIAHILQPERIVTIEGRGLENLPWPVGAETLSGEKAPPEMVPEARRRREFSTLSDSAQLHPFVWTSGGLMGGRLGRGTPLARLDDTLWAEVMAGTLFVLTPHPLTDAQLRRMMEDSNCDKVISAGPQDYKGLLVSLTRQDGSDFGLGLIEEVDLPRRTLLIRSSFPPETPIPIIKLGGMKLDSSGKQTAAVRLWSL